MWMEQTQSILVLLALVALAFSPMAYRWARRLDTDPQPASPAPGDPTKVPGVLSPREAVARHLYGQAVGWQWEAMDDYDTHPALRDTWLAEADRKLHPAGRLRIVEK